jgi:hypothetical protein
MCFCVKVYVPIMSIQKHAGCFGQSRDLDCPGQHEELIDFRVIFEACLIRIHAYKL